MDTFIQTRDEEGHLEYWPTLKAAFEMAYRNQAIWKVSFNTANGERIRLIRMGEHWVYDPIVAKEG